MEKEQIVKVLEVCSNYQGFGDCDKCPARERCDNEYNFLEKEALSLVREQEKRIEELENICDSYALQYGTVKDQQAVIDRVKAETARELFGDFGSILFSIMYFGCDGKYHLRKMSADKVTSIFEKYYELIKKYTEEQSK